MWLIVGLGNPGIKYENTRHNLGAEFANFIAEQNEIEFGNNKKLLTELTELKIGNEKILLAKPTTFMNLSGEAVRLIAAYYKINPDKIIVMHDELDLPFGVVRIKRGGGDAGHHGVESVTNAIGREFWRFRLGIGATESLDDGAKYVLQKFTDEEKDELPRIFKLSYEYLKKSLREGMSNTTLS